MALKKVELKYCGTLEDKQLLLTDFRKAQWNWYLKRAMKVIYKSGHSEGTVQGRLGGWRVEDVVQLKVWKDRVKNRTRGPN